MKEATETLKAHEVFKKAYDNKPNTMTPNPLSYSVESSYAVELSEGRGLTVKLSEGRGLTDSQIYGVTVLEMDGTRTSLSKLFHSRTAAEAYIEELGETISVEALTAEDRAYLKTALWSSTDPEDVPLDESYDIEDFALHTLKDLLADLHDFMEAQESLIEGFDRERVAGDFWLTRNRHGAGFWDGDYPEDIGDLLTSAAHVYGSVDLFVGDDGKIYC